jgi:hypothetical protein
MVLLQLLSRCSLVFIFTDVGGCMSQIFPQIKLINLKYQHVRNLFLIQKNSRCAALPFFSPRACSWLRMPILTVLPAASTPHLPSLFLSTRAGTSATALALGYEHTCAIVTNGSILCWGSNSKGQLGIGFAQTKTCQNVSCLTIASTVDIGSGGNPYTPFSIAWINDRI